MAAGYFRHERSNGGSRAEAWIRRDMTKPSLARGLAGYTLGCAPENGGRRGLRDMRAFGRAIAAGCIAMLAVGGGVGASAETLGDAIALAYETNPTLQSQRAQLRATDEEWVQAEASLRPTISASGSYQYQHEQISIPRDRKSVV